MRQSSAGRPATRVVLVLAAVGLLAATIGISIGRDDDPSSDSRSAETGSSTTSTTVAEVSLADLSGAARDLAELLAEGRAGTYHAVYTGRAADGEGGSLSLETWAKAGRFRQDTIVDVGGEPIHRANFVLPESGAACTRIGDAPWSCEDAPRSAVEGADLLNGNTFDQLRRAAVGESAGDVDGRPARCFTITYDAQTTELCASEDGVPLRIRSQASHLVIEELDTEVPDDIFDLPAGTS